MTIDEIKEELKAYKDDYKLIKSMEEQIEFYETKLTSCTAQLSNTPKGVPEVKDRLAEYIAKIEDLKAEKYSRLIEIENKKDCVEKVVNELKQPYKTLLYLTYIQVWKYLDSSGNEKTVIGHTLSETSYIMNYDYKYTVKLHGQALREYLKAREEINV